MLTRRSLASVAGTSRYVEGTEKAASYTWRDSTYLYFVLYPRTTLTGYGARFGKSECPLPARTRPNSSSKERVPGFFYI